MVTDLPQLKVTILRSWPGQSKVTNLHNLQASQKRLLDIRYFLFLPEGSPRITLLNVLITFAFSILAFSR